MTLALSAACGGSGRPGLMVAAAADLQFAFQDIGALFESDCGCDVDFIFGSSGNLAVQIENGMPADIFASADVAYVERLEEKGLLLEGSRRLYAVGRIVLAVNRDSGLHLTELRDLLDPAVSRVAIANPDHAPYGVAAMQALRSAGMWDEVKPKLVYGENVRQALQYVETGDAPAGIVALSVAGVPRISYVVLDEALHEPLLQSLAVLRRSDRVELARRFIDFVNGPVGGPIMKKYGFTLPEES